MDQEFSSRPHVLGSVAFIESIHAERGQRPRRQFLSKLIGLDGSTPYPQARTAIIPISPKNSDTDAAMPVYAAQR
jgi:hypothetical protein